jgi:hypothetical protein
MAFQPYCPPKPPVCEPEPPACEPPPPCEPEPCEPEPVACEPEPPCEPPPVSCEPEPPVVCEPEPPVCEPEPPVVCEPPTPPSCEPPQHGGNTGNSTNTISQGGNAGNVTAGSGTYVQSGSGDGGLINIAALNGIGGSNILSPSIGGPSIGLGAIFEQDVAGNGLLGSLFGKGGNTGDSTNTISQGGDAGNVTAGSGTAVQSGSGDGGLINISALNGLGGSNILSPSIGGPSVGLGAIFEQDVAGNGVLGSLFGKGGNTGDSTNTISQGGDAGNVTAGSGTAVQSGSGDGGLINISALNGLGGSNILSPSIGGPSVGVGAIFEQDAAGNGVLGSLFGKGANTGDSTNTVSEGGDAGDVIAGSGTSVQMGSGDGGLINISALNGLGGSNILSPSIGGPSVGVGAIFEQDAAGQGTLSSLHGKGGTTGDSVNTISEGGDAGNVTAGSGAAALTGGSDVGGLINAALLNGVGGSNILSPSIGGPSVGVGAIFEQDVAGHDTTTSLLGNGNSTGDSTNTISEGGDAGNVAAGSGLAALAGGSDVGGLINTALLNGVGGSNILSPSVGGPSLGLGAIFDQDFASAYDGHVPLVGDLASALGSTLDLLTTTSSLFDLPALDVLNLDSINH